MKICLLKGLKTNSSNFTVRKIKLKHYLTQLQTKVLKHTPMKLKTIAQNQVNWH